MSVTRLNRPARASTLIFSLLLLSGCGFLGDTKSINAATDLAIDCSTDEALAALDKAEEGGGLSKYLAALERVGILRDAGRDGEANEALAAYKALPEAASSSDEEIERSLDEFIEGLREERRERTGSPTCPG